MLTDKVVANLWDIIACQVPVKECLRRIRRSSSTPFLENIATSSSFGGVHTSRTQLQPSLTKQIKLCSLNDMHDPKQIGLVGMKEGYTISVLRSVGPIHVNVESKTVCMNTKHAGRRW